MMKRLGGLDHMECYDIAQKKTSSLVKISWEKYKNLDTYYSSCTFLDIYGIFSYSFMEDQKHI